jgi:hypothetical protein
MSLRSEAQNIVQNGGGEEITLCPTGSNQIFRAPPWESSAISPDLFNSCNSDDYSVSENFLGYQEANKGEGYFGLLTYSQPNPDVREFMQNTLLYELIAGEEYYIEFHVSQADSFQFVTQNLGVTFTELNPTTFLTCYPNCTIYVENDSSNPLTSKTEWVKISGTFTAQGGERYIHIGNFRTDDDSEIEFIGGGTDPNVVWNQAYYYIDDVWLSHIDSAGYVGVGEVEDDIGFEIYPNPTNGLLHIGLAGEMEGGYTVRLVSINGLLIREEGLSGSSTILDIADLSKGIYFVEVTSSMGEGLWRGKVILLE